MYAEIETGGDGDSAPGAFDSEDDSYDWQSERSRRAWRRVELQRVAPGSRLRMLMNNLDPMSLRIRIAALFTAALARAARNWEAFDAIVALAS
jgi:urocanate hydratase